MDQLVIFDDIDGGSMPPPLVEIPELAKEASSSGIKTAQSILDAVLDSGSDEAITKDNGSDRLHVRIQLLHELDQSVFWAMGDEIERHIPYIGKMRAFRVAAWAMGLSPRWAMEMAKVSRAFPPETRYAGIKWNTYRAAAASKNPRKVLELAVSSGWDARKVKAHIRATET